MHLSNRGEVGEGSVGKRLGFEKFEKFFDQISDGGKQASIKSIRKDQP